jgi:hypothetical protein
MAQKAPAIKDPPQKINPAKLSFADDLKVITQIYTQGPICINNGIFFDFP